MNPEKDNPIIYFCAGPEVWGIEVDSVKKAAGHWVGSWGGRRIIWPGEIDKETITPEKFFKLKEEFAAGKIVLIDRLADVEHWVVIKDHVSRAGPNFLMGKTPYKDLPRFPDLSHLYQTKKGFEEIVVHTVGPERFQDIQEETDTIWSEAAGLIAPVADYVGLKVTALGGDPGKTNPEELKKTNTI